MTALLSASLAACRQGLLRRRLCRRQEEEPLLHLLYLLQVVARGRPRHARAHHRLLAAPQQQWMAVLMAVPSCLRGLPLAHRRRRRRRARAASVALRRQPAIAQLVLQPWALTARRWRLARRLRQQRRAPLRLDQALVAVTVHQ